MLVIYLWTSYSSSETSWLSQYTALFPIVYWKVFNYINGTQLYSGDELKTVSWAAWAAKTEETEQSERAFNSIKEQETFAKCERILRKRLCYIRIPVSLCAILSTLSLFTLAQKSRPRAVTYPYRWKWGAKLLAATKQWSGFARCTPRFFFCKSKLWCRRRRCHLRLCHCSGLQCRMFLIRFVLILRLPFKYMTQVAFVRFVEILFMLSCYSVYYLSTYFLYASLWQKIFSECPETWVIYIKNSHNKIRRNWNSD